MAGPSARRLVAATIAAGFALRLALVLATVGSNDMEAWTIFASEVAARPICSVYVHSNGGPFNHPPLMGWSFALLYRFALFLHVPFYILYKLIPVAADAVVARLLWRVMRRRAGERAAALAVCAFALSPDAILVSAFHGNTDSVCLMLAFAGVAFLDEERPFIGGLALGLALDVKLIPVLLVPALLASTTSWRALLRSAGGFLVALLGFLPTAVACPLVLRDHVLGYSPHFDHWGLSYFFHLSRENPHWGGLAQHDFDWYFAYGRFVMMLAIASLAVAARLLRRWDRMTLAALTFAVFLLLTPGFGVQYTVYAGAFMIVADLPLGAAYAVVAGIFIGLFYGSFLGHQWPLVAHAWGRFPQPVPLVGILTWLVLTVFVVRALAQRGGPPSLASNAPMSSAE